jgi:hypothetical protein
MAARAAIKWQLFKEKQKGLPIVHFWLIVSISQNCIIGEIIFLL